MSQREFSFKGRKRGVILVLALWISMILAVMAYSVAYELRLNLRLAKQSQSILKARSLARAGVAKAVMDLRNDRVLAIADPAQMLTDSFKDVWATDEDKIGIELGDGFYSVRVEDEEGKINLNFINQRNAPLLGFVLDRVTEMDYPEVLMLGFLIADWMDPDSIPSAGQGENEIDFYTEWVHANIDDVEEGWVFEPKNDKFISLDELIGIPGITREMVYGDPYGDEEYEEPDDRIFLREESQRLADYFTVNKRAHHLNINTMSMVILEGLLHMVMPAGIGAEEMAEKIRDYRLNLAKTEGTRGTITDLTMLREVGMPMEKVTEIQQLYSLNVASNLFTITSTGFSGGVEKTLRYRVEVRVESFAINPEEPSTWGLRDRAAATELRHRLYNVVDPAVRVLKMNEL